MSIIDDNGLLSNTEFMQKIMVAYLGQPFYCSIHKCWPYGADVGPCNTTNKANLLMPNLDNPTFIIGDS